MKQEEKIRRAAADKFGRLDKWTVVRGASGWEVHVLEWYIGSAPEPSGHRAPVKYGVAIVGDSVAFRRLGDGS